MNQYFRQRSIHEFLSHFLNSFHSVMVLFLVVKSFIYRFLNCLFLYDHNFVSHFMYFLYRDIPVE